MVRSEVLTFSDPLAYQAAVRAGVLEVFVTTRGEFHAELTKIDLGRVWMQQASDNLARVIRATTDTTERAPVLFLADRDQPPMQHGGVELVPGEMIVYGRNAVHHSRTTGPSRWTSMSLTPRDLAAASEAITGRALTVPSETRIVRPAREPMARLMALHDETGRLARIAPHILARPAIARALEQELVHAMVSCLARPDPSGTKSCSGRHARVIARFEDFLAA